MKPNIFLLTIDSLRVDKTIGKSKSSITPNLDSLITNGACFKQAISTADQTGLSLGSLFTSLYPFKSGISYFNFDHNIPNFFSVLKKEGYMLNSFVPDLSFFQKITKSFHNNEYYTYDKREDWVQLVGFGDQIVEKLEQMDKPWFYFIHLMDLHAPFYLPEEFDKEEFGETGYDRMLSYIDTWIGKFLQKIDLEKTIFVLSSDHGDYISVLEEDLHKIKIPKAFKKTKKIIPSIISDPILSKLQRTRNTIELKKRKKNMTTQQIRTLQERGGEFLFDELVKIPFILTGLSVPPNLIINQQVRQVDIFPTLCQLIGVSNDLGSIHGRSLVPLLNEQSITEEPAYIESGSINTKKLGKVIGIRTTNYKYLRSRNDLTKNVTLYDLKNDPDETTNIAHSNEHIVNEMEHTLQKIRSGDIMDSPKSLTVEENEKIEKELRKLGYIE
jgi:arylsulfatase A-like enzyme